MTLRAHLTLMADWERRCRSISSHMCSMRLTSDGTAGQSNTSMWSCRNVVTMCATWGRVLSCCKTTHQPKSRLSSMNGSTVVCMRRSPHLIPGRVTINHKQWCTNAFSDTAPRHDAATAPRTLLHYTRI